jgi:hypothetical protein
MPDHGLQRMALRAAAEPEGRHFIYWEISLLMKT